MSDEPKNPSAPGNDMSRTRLRLGAWQPFTGSGLGAFADAPAWRTCAWLLFASVLTGLVLAWLLRSAWWPVVTAAAEAFPETTLELRNGSLDWQDAAPRILAEAPKFAIALRTPAPASPGRIADLQLELWPTECRISGIAGFVAWPWPPDWNLSLDRRDAVAGWGAWKRPLLLAAGATAGAVNLIAASAWSLLLTPPLWILGWILGRGLRPGGAFRLALVSTVAPSLGAATAILGYGFLWIPWPFLLAALGFHPLATLLMGCWAIVEMPPGAARPEKATVGRPSGKPPSGTNPFTPKAAAKSGNPDAPVRGKRRTSNPFRR